MQESRPLVQSWPPAFLTPGLKKCQFLLKDGAPSPPSTGGVTIYTALSCTPQPRLAIRGHAGPARKDQGFTPEALRTQPALTSEGARGALELDQMWEEYRVS
jgi:hypothetical protein